MSIWEMLMQFFVVQRVKNEQRMGILEYNFFLKAWWKQMATVDECMAITYSVKVKNWKLPNEGERLPGSLKPH